MPGPRLDAYRLSWPAVCLLSPADVSPLWCAALGRPRYRPGSRRPSRSAVGWFRPRRRCGRRSVTSEARSALLALAAEWPAGQPVPVPLDWLLDLLGTTSTPNTVEESVIGMDMNCRQLAEALGRDASTVRGWVARGEFPGAYRLNQREWRVPPEALRQWQDRQRAAPSGSHSGAVGTSRRRGLRLSSWRAGNSKERGGADEGDKSA